ncbi:MAG: type I restriction endonuclease subunit R, partial [Ignavibacteriaceae bacterium]|nr:type I restriction endonuclease subunit R [Ignavibacteriaceae bacterium]
MKFNEDSRVKLPAILHLTKLGYKYLSLKKAKWDENTNIFTEMFIESISKINDGVEPEQITRVLEDVSLFLGNEDLGKTFYERLIAQSGVKLIDFQNINNNTFNVVTELTYKNGDEEFRPDITLLINGMPLFFIEVKKPNNRDGIIAERQRINRRFQNKKFRKFVNITQLMVFSNNMEYEESDPTPIQGAFYATTSYSEPIFNYFREEEKLDLSTLLLEENESIEDYILKDNNLITIKYSPEFITNKSPNTPTNRLSTSLFSKERLAFILNYAITYVKEFNTFEKHVMRYPQIFAAKAIENKLNAGIKKGIIWHTQGSGKTALAFYNVKFLTDYYQKQSVVPKFYFIVDRLDLLMQAKREFSARGLVVHTVDSKDEFKKDIKKVVALHNAQGKPEITVVNIHKFSELSNVVSQNDYNIGIQRIYFLDEVHRSYNPMGSFLANLFQSDPNSIKIGLTGTPLIGTEFDSKAIFGDYIHTYYYNKSIADGYTLRLIREEISTEYKIILASALEQVTILKGSSERKLIYSHHQFVAPMLDYIVSDFEQRRVIDNDSSIGAMVVCDSSEQAKMMFEIFQQKYQQKEIIKESLSLAADIKESYSDKLKQKAKVKSAALILHDIGTKEERKQWVEDFKDGKIDLLFVYNMLLTGFDCKRLKKLYLGRVIKKHNLLQTLTRVNRTYKDFKYGYVVDFADISKEFDATNKAYFEELQSELGDDLQNYSNLFKTKDEIEEDIIEIRELLFHYNTENAELFSQQISQIQDRKTVLEIKRILVNAKELYNVIRLLGHYDLLEKADFKKLDKLLIETSNHLDFLNLREAVENNVDFSGLLNEALENVLFTFTKISEEELVIADKLKDALRKTREEFNNNFDPHDPEFVSLYEELKRIFKLKNLDEVTQEEMNENIHSLNKIYERIKELNRKNNLMKDKYENDKKFTRIHKRILDLDGFNKKEIKIFDALKDIKQVADSRVLQSAN